MVDKERQSLYKVIWNIANGLRGSVDGWDFKNYVFGFMFYRFISEDFVKHVNSTVNAGEDFNYENEDDDAEWIQDFKDTFIEEKGFFILPSQLFNKVREKLWDDPHLNAKISTIFRDIEETTAGAASKQNFSGLFKGINLADEKLGEEVSQKNNKIRCLLNEIGNMNLKTQESDIFGDAFEYLMGMYASNAGKSGGEYYTPPEVSELLVKLVSSQLDKISTVYDPTCGSGSLLLKFLKINGEKNNDISFYGQEINRTTYNLCRMNFFLHSINYEEFDIRLGDTLIDDKFLGSNFKQFDAIVSNPPYSLKWEGKDNIELKEDPRFIGAGAFAPKSSADLAFIQHSVYHLKNHGVAAIVCFPGILYRARAEQQIRKWLIEQSHIDAIIQLPPNLFYGTTISTCIMVLKKSRKNNDVLFIDGSGYFKKVATRNRLDPEHIEAILNLYIERKEVEHLTKIATPAEIEEKDFNLSVDVYVEKEDTEEKIDIEAINAEIPIRRKRITELWDKIDEIVKKIEESN